MGELFSPQTVQVHSGQPAPVVQLSDGYPLAAAITGQPGGAGQVSQGEGIR